MQSGTDLPDINDCQISGSASHLYTVIGDFLSARHVTYNDVISGLCRAKPETIMRRFCVGVECRRRVSSLLIIARYVRRTLRYVTSYVTLIIHDAAAAFDTDTMSLIHNVT